MELREKLIVLRDEAGLSQQAVASQLGLSRQAITRWESGATVPTMDNLKSLAKIYNTSLDWLCQDTDVVCADVQTDTQKPSAPDCAHCVWGETRRKKSKKRKILKLCIVAGLILLGMLVSVCIIKNHDKRASNVRQIGDLIEEDLTGAPESEFEFYWED